MISPGATVLVRQTGAQLWCVKGPASGGAWYLVAKRTDPQGQVEFFSRIATAADITVIAPAPDFGAGDIVKFDDTNCIVVQDLGDDVMLISTPAPTALRGAVHGGDKRLVGKCSLVLAGF